MIFGTYYKKLFRRDGSDTSELAALLLDSTELEKMVYKTIKGFGREGCIADQILAIHADKAYSSITARFKALMDKGLVIDTGARRAGKSGRGQRVMRSI